MKKVLPIIVISQFLCTSTWFTGSVVAPAFIQNLNLDQSFVGWMTSSVQAGFILGTLIFAFTGLADKFSPVKIFSSFALLAAFSNILISLEFSSIFLILTLRVITGIALAGIYPVGMKIAADHSKDGLGKLLGWLVGALVLGTALPHFLAIIGADWDWKFIVYGSSGLCLLGGVLMFLFVKDGPYRMQRNKLASNAIGKAFKIKAFRVAALGYFGHMWELYAFWAFVPWIIGLYAKTYTQALPNSLLSFSTIGIGAIACVVFGYFSMNKAKDKLAFGALAGSLVCCILLPFVFYFGNLYLFIALLLAWGFLVIPDSPLFSTLVAQSVPAEINGASLMIVNCIGFAITIVSIQLLSFMNEYEKPWMLWVLAIGPILGLIGYWRSEKKTPITS